VRGKTARRVAVYRVAAVEGLADDCIITVRLQARRESGYRELQRARQAAEKAEDFLRVTPLNRRPRLCITLRLPRRRR